MKLIKNTYPKNSVECSSSGMIYYKEEIVPNDEKHDYTYQHPWGLYHMSYEEALEYEARSHF